MNTQPPLVYTPPFQIVADQREKKIWDFAGITRRIKKRDVPVEINVVLKHLKTGDYSIEGMEDVIAIERKSVRDLVQTVSQHRERFKRELERLSELKHGIVLIEGDWRAALLECRDKTSFSPKALDSLMIRWQLSFPNVAWVWRPNRFCAAKTCWKFFDLFYKDHLRNA